jgi:hypothetical protein
VRESSPPAGDMPDDIDELRRLHDSPSAPPGPHSLPGDVPMPAPANATDTSEAPAAVSAPLEQESAPVSSPPQPVAMPEDRPAIDAEPAPVDAEMPEAQPTRTSILAAFARNRTPSSPQPAPPQPRPAELPWFAGQQAPKARENLSDEAVDELIAGWRCGNLAWPRRLLGGEPGNPDCRLSRETLRRNGLA